MTIKGIGPERGAALAEAGIVTVGDLLNYLPFRYEDRIRFTKISDTVPGQVATILAEVVEGAAVRFSRARNAMFHLTVQDGSGRYLYARFFHGGYMEGRYKAGQRLVLHGKIEWDPRRPGRKEHGESADRIAGRRRSGPAGRFHRSGPHRPDLRIGRRGQLADAYAGSSTRC